jgi:hypothetical protein
VRSKHIADYSLSLSAVAPFDWVEQIKPQKNLARSKLSTFLLKGLYRTTFLLIYLQGAVLYCTSHSLTNKDDDESPDVTVLRPPMRTKRVRSSASRDWAAQVL